jgi:membrane associated rhomboid family serine protease
MTRWVARLIYVTVAAFVVTFYVAPQFIPLLYLVPADIPRRPWTVITYMFLHGSWMHLIFNMLALFFFGPRLELRLGSRRFLGLYFVSGMTGALLSLATPHARIIGASGAVFGVLLAFARYWPREQIYIWGVVPVQARVLVAIMAVLALFGGFTGMNRGIADFAHLGGFLGGFLFIKWHEHQSPGRRFAVKAAPPPRPGGDRASLERWERIRRDELHPVNRSELDRVMEKIEKSGISSLTPDERAFLDRFAPD